jgi:hypothetical protein
MLATPPGQHLHRLRVDCVCQVRLLFGLVYLRVSGAIDAKSWAELFKDRL